MEDFPHQLTQINQFNSGVSEFSETPVVTEKAVGLCVNGQSWFTFMCTPVDIDALAVGFLYNEGMLHEKSEIENIHICKGNEQVDLWLTHEISKPDFWRKTSGCSGGLSSIEISNYQDGTLQSENLPLAPSSLIDKDVPLIKNMTSNQITYLMTKLYAGQNFYKKSGGMHTSVLCDGMETVCAMEDIGRHNTLDKISGRCLLEGTFPDNTILLTTGRISSEMLQKSLRLNAKMVISRTSPTSMSVDLAHKFGITLIGYARKDQFNIYTHPERIIS